MIRDVRASASTAQCPSHRTHFGETVLKRPAKPQSHSRISDCRLQIDTTTPASVFQIGKPAIADLQLKMVGRHGAAPCSAV
jgi:hypothetical protein